MKKYVFIAILLGCAACIETPDDYGPFAPPVMVRSAAESFAAEEEAGCIYDAGAYRDGDGLHLRRI